MKDLQKLLHALNRVTAVLLAARDDDNLEASILQGMELLGRCVDADRVVMWRNETIGGALYYVQQQQWCSDVGRTYLSVLQGAKIPYSNTPEWEPRFLRGETINCPLSQLPSSDQDLLCSYGIKTLIAVPLFLENQFWGFLSLDDCIRERVATDEEISVLRSMGLLFASALLRHRMLVTMSAKEALERFEVVWANVECGITIIDAETREILDVNPVAARMFGESKEAIVGHRCHKFICPAESCACPIMDKNQVVDRSERKFVRVDGTAIPIVKSVAKIMLNGRLALLESFTDISNLKEAEKQLLQMQVTEQANKAKSYFLSTMSHEMRTPMNAIIGMTAIGKASADPARKQHALEKIEDASKHLLGIINDVLDLSKIEAGKFDLSPEEFTFEKMLQRVVNVVAFRLDEKKLNFNVLSDPAIPPVLIGDDQRLAQIITNLLGNAVKFTPANGSVSLNARMLNEDDGLCTIQIDVTDSGIGISPEQQTHLFESFRQADSNTARKYGGTGLGLSISKSIVEMMGGTIWVESELDRGTTFAFTVQLRRGDSRQYDRLTRETNWKNLRILVVDDNTGIREYLKSYVERFGARCDTARSGQDALQLVRANGAYDLCFVDWKMPDMDGFGLTKELKTLSPDCDQHVVLMTSSSGWSDVEDKASQAGVNAFLTKPLFPSAITDVINGCLGVVRPVEVPVNSPVVFAGRRILLAEDVEINREIVLTLLEPTRLTIDCATNGTEAVSLFQQAPNAYDLILMDVQMPEMDGYEATRQIRALDLARAKDIPIIAMTANVFREDIEKCLAAGMNDHIGKPIDINEVLVKLRQVLDAPVRC